MDWESTNANVNAYCRLRDKQYAVYERHARRHGLTAKELFILDILHFAEEGCTQAEICERLSAPKQAVSATVKKFWKSGYLVLEESEADRRSKIVRLSDAGRRYTERVVAPAARAENEAMAELSAEQQEMLVRLTDAFSEHMRAKFEAIEGEDAR